LSATNRRKNVSTNLKTRPAARLLPLIVASLLMFLWTQPVSLAQVVSPSKAVHVDPIVGTWNCQIPPAGGAPGFTVLKNIHVGGTESEIDNAAPPSQESPTIGTWVNTGDRTYSQNAYQMSWDPSGNFIGTWNYTGPMTLSPSLKHLNIQGTATLVDGNGTVVTTFPFTASCARL
jgi:hypothetical protein